jgi:uncharacterized membrane protein
MLKAVIGFANVIMIALVAGTVFGVWLGYDPASLSSTTYVEQQQHAIEALNVTMPVLGAIAFLLTLTSAALVRAQPRTLVLLLGVAACLLAAGLITRFGNQPINALVMTWNAAAPPEDWTHLRDTWWHWHIVRTLAMVVALGLIVVADPMGRRSN